MGILHKNLLLNLALPPFEADFTESCWADISENCGPEFDLTTFVYPVYGEALEGGGYMLEKRRKTASRSDCMFNFWLTWLRFRVDIKCASLLMLMLPEHLFHETCPK